MNAFASVFTDRKIPSVYICVHIYHIHIINVNVHVYSPDIPVGSADCTIYTPGIGTHSFTVSSPLGRIQHLRTLLQLYPIITIQLSRSTRYPSLLGGQRRHDMRGLPNTSTHGQ